MTQLGSTWQRARAIVDRDWVMLPVTIVTLAVYLAAFHARRFIPHDEGLLAQSAERVLNGEWPHRDFDDPYTGGLALLHAGAMHLFGVDLLALRRLLLCVSIGFCAVIYRIARRIATPLLASFLTWGALSWAMPSYAAGLPSWYNLVAATLALLFTLRAIEQDHARDVVLAGVFGGLSLLIKVVGVFHIAAGLLSLMFAELTRATVVSRTRSASIAHGLVRVGVVVFALGVSLVLPATASVMERLHFTLPSWLLAYVLIRADLRLSQRGVAISLGSLLATAAKYSVGVALPIGVFLWPYLTTHSVGALIHGVFVAPQQRITAVSASLPPFWTLIAAVPMGCALLAPHAIARLVARPRAQLVLAMALALLATLGARHGVYLALWFSLRPLVPLATLAVALLALHEGGLEPLPRMQLFCVAASTSLASLVQFPYASGLYFLYVAPLLWLLLAFCALQLPAATRKLWLALGCAHAAFALLWLNTGEVRSMGVRYVRDASHAYLDLPRGGLDVPFQYALTYMDLVAAIQAHSANNSYIYAAPDCPEVYFLSGRRNPTRTFYDLFDSDFALAPEARARRILHSLERHHVDLAVVCKHPEFSGRMSSALTVGLELRYPHRVDVPPLFSVHFRDRSDPQHTEPRQ